MRRTRNNEYLVYCPMIMMSNQIEILSYIEWAYILKVYHKKEYLDNNNKVIIIIIIIINCLIGYDYDWAS